MRKNIFFLAMLLLYSTISLSQPTRQISGKIIDSKDKSPLTGVTITTKGTKSTAISGPDGSFTIKVGSRSSSLHFSYIGYDDQEIPITESTDPIVISLSPTQKAMNEVVVVGYGKASRRDLTGSISRIDAKEVQDFPSPSFESAIQGKAPGVVVASGSGRVGEAIQINIRGISSISASTQPLYVVDGLPISYAQIVADLQLAINLLPASNQNYRADVYSAHAMLSRVYLQMGMYAEAAAQADTVIGSGNFALTSTYDKTFNVDGNSSEDLFAIQQSLQSNAGTTNNGLGTFYIPYPTGRGDAQVDPNYAAEFEPADFRINYVTNGSSISGLTGNYPNKWGAFYKSVPVIRLAEMYLTRGEGNLIAGTTVGDLPLNDINTVRSRSGASMLATVSQTDFIEERFRELGFEGDRMWSEKRMKWNISGLDYDNDKLVMPIPQTEIDANKNLKQNNGY